MILAMMAVYDVKARAYLPPIFVRSPEVAMRAVGDACSDPKHEWSRHGADFHLYQFGAFADDSGSFTLFKEPVNYGPISQWAEVQPRANLAAIDSPLGETGVA